MSRILAGLVLLGPLTKPAVVRAQGDSARTDLESKTVEVSYEVYAGGKTPKEARQQAIEGALAEAVRRAIGTQVQAQRRSSTIETGGEVVSRFSEVVRTGASGRVVEREVLSEERVQRGAEPFYRVRVRARIEPASGRPDPGFQVDLRLTDADQTFVARSPLEESDEIIAEMEVTEGSYITLFSVTPDTVEVIWPNALSKNTFVPANTTAEFPPSDLRVRGLHLRVEVPPGEDHVTHRLVAVATKQEVPFQEVPEYHVSEGELKATQASVESLNRWLVDIPLGQRAVQSVTYDVVRASSR